MGRVLRVLPGYKRKMYGLKGFSFESRILLGDSLEMNRIFEEGEVSSIRLQDAIRKGNRAD